MINKLNNDNDQLSEKILNLDKIISEQNTKNEDLNHEINK